VLSIISVIIDTSYERVIFFMKMSLNFWFVTVAVGGADLAGCKGFDICFGGRRKFCRADYSDLGMKICYFGVCYF